MPKSVHVFSRKWGDMIYCPYCDYKLKNNKKGVILHVKKTHSDISTKKTGETKLKDVKTCLCGKRNCEKYKVHTPSR